MFLNVCLQCSYLAVVVPRLLLVFLSIHDKTREMLANVNLQTEKSVDEEMGSWRKTSFPLKDASDGHQALI